MNVRSSGEFDRTPSGGGSGTPGAPGQPIPGQDGADGEPGQSIPGQPGADSTVPGPAGATGAPIPGQDGADGEPGQSIPGPAGIGTPGADGATGLTIPGPQGDAGEDSMGPSIPPGDLLAPSAVRNGSIATQGGANGFQVDTYLTDSNLLVASGGGLQVRTMFRWYVSMSKTAAGLANPTAIIRIGTAGAIGDAAVVTLTGVAQTAVTDTGLLTITAIIQSLGAAGVLQVFAGLIHLKGAQAGLAGLGGQEGSGAFNTAALRLQAGVSLNFGVGMSLTVTQVQAEMVQPGIA